MAPSASRSPRPADDGSPGPRSSSLAWAALVLAGLLGLVGGLGVFTFGYAEGWSYFSSEPKACVNCHVMRPQFESWQRSSHHGVARCVDCHLPHPLVPKLIAKGLNGYHHSLAFTTGNFHEPIEIHGPNSRILEDNCRDCHGALVAEINHGGHDGHGAEAGDPRGLRCVHCHRSVGHGP